MTSSVNLPLGTSSVLYTLQKTSEAMTEVNYRLATGLEVNSALDDPINYFAAQNHTYRASDLELRKDSMGEAVQLITAANEGVDAILDLVDDAIALANSALTAEDAAEATELETAFNEIISQIDDLAEDSYYNGTNLLGGATETLDVFFNEDGSSMINLVGEDASSTGLGLTAVTAGDWWDATATPEQPNDTNINTVLDNLRTAKGELRGISKSLSMDLSIIETRVDFTDELINTLTDGAGKLVNADLNEESANLLTLQTQQSLGINSLSAASDAAASVLNLF